MYNVEKIIERLRSVDQIRVILSNEERTRFTEDLASKDFIWASGRKLTDKRHPFYSSPTEFKWYNFYINSNRTCTWIGKDDEPTAMSDEEVYMARDFLNKQVVINNDLFFQLISS